MSTSSLSNLHEARAPKPSLTLPATVEDAIPVGVNLQTFIDNYLVDSVQGIRREVHEPVRHPANPLLVADQPWETMLYFTMNTWNVLYNEERDVFQCWYEDWEIYRNLTPEMRAQTNSSMDQRRSRMRLLYAESSDGLHWTKPLLDVVPAHAGTNIIAGSPEAGNVHATCVFRDPKETDPQRRYKAIFTHYPADETSTHGIITIAHSADGIQWTPYEEKPNFGASGPRLGDVWTMYYEEETGRYIMPTRHIHMHWHGKLGFKAATPYLESFLGTYYPEDPGRMSKRRVSLCVSDNLFTWNEPVEILVPNDDQDNLEDCFYGIQVEKLGDLYLGFAHLLRKVQNTMEVYLVYSRDLVTWRRVAPWKPFLALGSAGAWDRYMVNMPTRPIQRGEETWVYYGGSRCHHDWYMTGPEEGLDCEEARHPETEAGFGLGLAVLKRNRYVSLQATVRVGLICTKPLIAQGQRLVINAKCAPGGSIRVAMMDEQGQALPRRGHLLCDEFTGDSIEHEVAWQGDAHVDSSRPLRLHFYLRQAEIFGFQFTG